MNQIRSILLAALLTLLAPPAHADFIGRVVLVPTGCENGRTCRLGEDFGYVDAFDYGWKADKGNVTDGASIPSWAQKSIGIPFDKRFLKAAVLHDHYCDRNVRGWYQTHRMFYTALRESGVSKRVARTMYLAVLVGGPKWIFKLKEKKPCPYGKICFNNVETIELQKKKERYGTPSYEKDLREAMAVVAANPDMELDQVDELVRQKVPEELYWQNKGIEPLVVSSDFEDTMMRLQNR